MRCFETQAPVCRKCPSRNGETLARQDEWLTPTVGRHPAPGPSPTTRRPSVRPGAVVLRFGETLSRWPASLLAVLCSYSPWCSRVSTRCVLRMTSAAPSRMTASPAPTSRSQFGRMVRTIRATLGAIRILRTTTAGPWMTRTRALAMANPLGVPVRVPALGQRRVPQAVMGLRPTRHLVPDRIKPRPATLVLRARVPTTQARALMAKALTHPRELVRAHNQPPAPQTPPVPGPAVHAVAPPTATRALGVTGSQAGAERAPQTGPSPPVPAQTIGLPARDPHHPVPGMRPPRERPLRLRMRALQPWAPTTTLLHWAQRSRYLLQAPRRTK
jgi:hypothetical protein